MKDDIVAVMKEKLRSMERILGWEFGDQSECCGLTGSQRAVIIELGGKGRSSLVDLAQSLGLDTSTLSRTINGLVNIGLVRREIQIEDRRYITLTLSAQGSKTYQRIETLVDDYFRKLLEIIPSEKHKGIASSLSLLAGALEKTRKRGEPCAEVCVENNEESDHVRDKKRKR